ncbi:MAG: hypothetical protein EPN70_14440 [Paraburkholderia sp.]|uniref:hypothetical protein n=1 Tax=Paraburkholderia sp. TaxID=1926495 RepID=UPI0012222A7E|nr:hypothetical protein [Paraburkholderia sp.]TAM03319.1 MAG: hypothetical protein EPN70_14440 [Paraburkholderia sp.]TAM30208.1 MAG: hypothetical protein EPN59_10160 [Paraburkholderia sp.]
MWQVGRTVSRMGAFELTIKELPKGKQKGSFIGPDDAADAQSFTKTVDLLPNDGYVFAPGSDFYDATAVVLPIGARVWITARLDYGGDYVSTSNIAVVSPIAGKSNDAGEVQEVQPSH